MKMKNWAHTSTRIGIEEIVPVRKYVREENNLLTVIWVLGQKIISISYFEKRIMKEKYT